MFHENAYKNEGVKQLDLKLTKDRQTEVRTDIGILEHSPKSTGQPLSGCPSTGREIDQ